VSSDVGRYRRAYPRIFRHPAFKQLAPLGQRLALYLLFGPQSNRIGLFYLSVNTAAEDLKASADSLRKALGELAVSFGWTFDASARVFYIPTWWRWNPPDHAKVLMGNLKDISEIPPCGLVDAFAANLAYLTPELHETFLEAIRVRLGEATPSQYQDQDQDQKQKRKTALRAGAEKGKGKDRKAGPTPTTRMLKIAKKVHHENPRATTESFVDHFLYLCREEKIDANKAVALVAMAKSTVGQSQQGASA
jgi:hypothetical protein